MTEPQFDEKAIFGVARKIESPEARQEYLLQVCGDDSALLDRISDLLHGLEKQESFLEEPAVDVTETMERTPTETEGAQIGPYKLLQAVGEGGMGVVYMAEQTEPVRRRVALKIIKPGMDSRQVLARFEAERQALALMDHPNIAKVLDASTTESGRPYFVMELVKGMPITKYCDEHQLTPRERLDLFIPVCQAVQHAHQKGIIHRDLKPGNVLVAPYDGQPIPKVIDFGIAKATTQRLTDKTMFTQLGTVVGTLEYMSPEQAQVNQLDVDTRSDIYSLGVLLYELLTGATPFDRQRLRSAAFDEMMRIIREEEPPRPSMRLSTIDTLPTVAATRRTEPKKLRSLVRGELDWIVMKALEKDRSRRYETANGFAEDIQRYLEDDAVVACPPSAGYRFRKFARRNKAMLGTVAIVAVALSVGLVSTLIQWRRAEDQRKLAVAETKRADVTRLKSQAESIRDELPVTGVKLAMEAVRLAQQYGGSEVPVAHESLLNVVQGIGGRPLPGHDGRIRVVRIDPHGRWVVTASADGTVRLCPLTTNSPETSSILLEGSPTSIKDNTISRRIGISPDGHWLVLGDLGLDPAVRFLDLRIENPADHQLTLSGHRASITRIAFSLRSGNLATASSDGRVKIWDLPDEGEPKSSLELPHDEPVDRVAIGPEGRWVATACKDGTAWLWDLAAEDPATSSTELIGHTGQVSSVAISSNGQWLATSSGDVTVRLWKLTDENPGNSSLVLKGHQFGLKMAISPDSRWLATGSGDTTARLWDLMAEDPSERPLVLRGHQRLVWNLTFSPDGRWLVTGSEDATARLWDLQSADPAAFSTLLRGHKYGVMGAEFSPDKRWLVTRGHDSTVARWDLGADDPAVSPVFLRAHEDTVGSMAIDPSSHWLVTGGWDGTTRLWDLDTANPASALVIFNQGPIQNSMETSADGRRLVTVGDDNGLQVWSFVPSDSAPLKLEETLRGHQAEVMSVSIGRRHVATGSLDGNARVWDLARPEAPIHVLQGGSDALIWYIAISPEGRWLATGAGKRNAELWDLWDRTPSPRKLEGYQSVPGSPPYYHPIAMNREGTRLAAADGLVVSLWDLPKTDPVTAPMLLRVEDPLGGTVEAESDGLIARVGFSPDGRWLVTQHIKGLVGLWDLSQNRADGVWKLLRGHDGLAYTFAFDNSSQRLLTVSWAGDYSARVWDLSDPAPESIQLGSTQTGALYAAAFSPDGRMVVTGGHDKLARVWDLNNPRTPYLLLRGHESFVNAIAFTPDGKWIYTRSNDRTVRFWQWEIDSLMESARSLAGGELTDEQRMEYDVPAITTDISN